VISALTADECVAKTTDACNDNLRHIKQTTRLSELPAKENQTDAPPSFGLVSFDDVFP